MKNERGAIFMPTGNPGKRKKQHSGETKQKVVEYMREKGLSYRETGRIFEITHTQTIAWERIYLEEGIAGLYEERRGRASSKEGIKKGKPPKLTEKVEEDLIA